MGSRRLLGKKHPLLYNRHHQSLPTLCCPHSRKSILLTAVPAPGSELRGGKGTSLLAPCSQFSLQGGEWMCSCRTRGGHSLTRTKGSPQRVSLCWAPRPSLQLVSRAGLSDPASMLTHSLDSSSSHPTLCLSQHQGRGTRISPGAGVGWRGVVTERLWRFGSLGAAGKAGSSIKPHQISGGKQPRGVHTVTAQLISIRCRALSASLTT